MAALLQHVLGLGILGIVGAVLVDVGAHVGEQVGPVARVLQGGPQARQVALVGGELLAQQRQVVLLQGGGGESGFRVEEAGELGDDGFALDGLLAAGRLTALAWQELLRTFSKSSSILVSAVRSSSDGFGGMLAALENCEYVWNRFSV